MYTIGSFNPAPNAADWSEYIEVLDDDTGTAFDLTDALIELEVRDAHGRRKLFGSTDDAKIELLGDGFQFTFPSTEMSALCPGSYAVNIRITDSVTGFVSEPVIANLPVLEGGFH